MAGTRLRAKRAGLGRLLHEYESVCVGYSGGVDSVFLAKVALDELGPDRVLAVTGRSASYPGVQHRMALECVQRFGIPHLEVETHELADPNYAANPNNRCYFCKTELWSRLDDVAREHGLRTVVDGSNADDPSDHRPGAVAAREHGVRSPLQEAGFTKQDIRVLSRELGLPTWDQPASPCLASRLVYGLGVTPARLSQVERAEALLRGQGLREFRVRHHGDAARIEVSPTELEAGLDAVCTVLPRIREETGFDRVLLDVEGYRRGALNEGLVRLAPSGSASGAVERQAGPAAEEDVGAERLLARAGIAGSLEAVGRDRDVAAVVAAADAFGAVRELAPEIRAAGYRYVALDIAVNMD